MPIMQAFPDAIRKRLESVGFSFHNGDAEPLVNDPTLRGQYWYCWCGPNGGWDVESGDSFDSMEGAIVSAIDAVVAFAFAKGQDEADADERACTNPSGHQWNRTAGEADEARLSGDHANDNIRCVYCGADGDA